MITSSEIENIKCMLGKLKEEWRINALNIIENLGAHFHMEICNTEYPHEVSIYYLADNGNRRDTKYEYNPNKKHSMNEAFINCCLWLCDQKIEELAITINTYRIGNIFKCKHDEPCILSQVSPGECVLMGILSGNRVADAYKVKNVNNITEDEISNMGREKHNYVASSIEEYYQNEKN